MKLLLLLLLLLTSCNVLKRKERVSIQVDSLVHRTGQLTHTVQQAQEQLLDWQQFRLPGLDSLYRLPDLHIHNSPVPLIPQFVSGNDRIIYLPRESNKSTQTVTNDSLWTELVRLQRDLYTRQNQTEKTASPLINWSIIAVSVAIISLVIFLTLKRRI